MRERLLLALIVAAACFAFYLPSSVGSAISRPLSVVSIAGMCGLLAAIVVVSGRVAPAMNLVAAASTMFLLTVFTVTSPFDDYSPGVLMLYGALAILYLQNLRALRSPRIEQAFRVVTAISLGAGYAVALNVAAADRLLVTWYSGFYQELVPNMVLLNKPVLTFATHSMAGFMVYLLFYMQWYGWRCLGGWWRLTAAIGYIGLLAALTSTTGMAYFVVASAQVGVFTARRVRYKALAAGLVLLAAVALVASRDIDYGALVRQTQAAVVGDRVRGLAARYGSEGLLAGNMAYLAESPLSPIGFGATDTLYLGDSGIVVNILRGSLPLLLAVYVGLWLFLDANLRDRRTAIVVFLATLAFEVGFNPMMYFRFVAFVPFLVVYMNSVTPPAAARPSGFPGVR
jgi:hypothetical protein